MRKIDKEEFEEKLKNRKSGERLEFINLEFDNIDFTSKHQFVEVFLNGEYEGVYILCDQSDSCVLVYQKESVSVDF